MKKSIFIFLILVFVLQFTGCDEENTEEQVPTKTESTVKVIVTPSPPAATFLPVPLPQPVGSDKPDSPTFDKEPGVYIRTEPLIIEIKKPDGDGKIFYTLNGVRPDRSSNEYSEPITVLDIGSNSIVLSAVFITDKGAVSEVTFAKYEYPIEFEDAALEKILIDYFKPENEMITYSMMRKIKELNIVGNYVVINDTEKFLEEITYEFKKDVFEYDEQKIGGRGSIKTLNDLSWMHNLQSLIIDYNQITEVTALPGMIDVVVLKNNFITDISGISEDIYPSVVVLDSNLITNTFAIGENNNQELRYLSLSNNPIEIHPYLTDNNVITSLWLDNTGLTDWPKLSFRMILNTLDLSRNNLIGLSDQTSFLRVNNLFLNNSNISDISGLLVLQSNIIRTATGYEEADNTGYCLKIDLSNNDISDFTPLLYLDHTMKLTLLNNSVKLDMDIIDQLTWMEVITE